MRHLPTPVSPGSRSPKAALRVGAVGWSLTWVPMILKSISRPFSFSMIRGWAEVMWKSWAMPVAGVGDHHAQVERFGRLDFVGERVVAVDVALLEVVQDEVGVGEHGDVGGQQRHDNLDAVFHVAQRPADAGELG